MVVHANQHSAPLLGQAMENLPDIVLEHPRKEAGIGVKNHDQQASSEENKKAPMPP